MTKFLQVITTTDSRERASDMAQHLLKRRLAGCVQVSGPISSTYWWEGELVTSEEWACVIKTAADRYEEVEQEIRTRHTYDEPEILACPIVAGSAGYLRWLGESLEGR